MAKCQCCGREMLTAKGCTYRNIITKSGYKYNREKVGDEGWIEPGQRCGDCGAEYGNYHHPGCDNERCPICHGQLITCDCELEFFAK